MKFAFEPRLLDAFRATAGFDLRQSLLYLCYWGSKAENTYLAPGRRNGMDDLDLLAVLDKPQGSWHARYEQWDLHVLSLPVFLQQAPTDPNVLAALWVRPDEQLIVAEAFKPVLEAREAFISQELLKALRGAASRAIVGLDPMSYEGFLAEERRKLYLRLLFDTHAASHLLRLLKMTKELVETGELVVFREDDADLLKAIKRGYFKLDEVIAMASRITAAVEVASPGVLPLEPNYERISLLTGEKPMKFKPLNDHVLIKRQAREATTKGGLVIPESHQTKSRFGEVLAVGPGRFKKDSTERVPMGIQAGDVVLFRGVASAMGEVQMEEEGEFIVLREDDIDGIVEEP